MIAIGNMLGIDPGANGGLALISHENIIQAFRMPETEAELAELFKQRIVPAGVSYALIETVPQVPDKGKIAIAKQNRNAGILVGLLLAHEIPFEEMHPKTWQSALGIQKRIRAPRTRKPIMNYPQPETDRQWKKRLQDVARKLFPEVRVTLEISDALLIAEVARRMHFGFRGRSIA